MESYSIIKTNEELESVRKEFFTHRYRSGYRIYNGYTLSESYARFAEEIDNFQVYDDDIWITSFPKAGSTWTSEIVWCIANDFNCDPLKEPLPYRVPYLEFCTIFNICKNEPCTDFNPICNSINIAKNAKRPRFIKTHLPWELLPKQIRTFQRKPKIFHVIRNPKDACVSYFHHCTLVEGYTGTFEDFWQLFINNKLNYTPYWKNVYSFYNQKNANILCILYEDMRKNLGQNIKVIANYLGKPIEDQQLLDKVVKYLNYSSMMKINEKHFESVVEFLKQFNLCKNETGHFMRAGLVGNYKAQMCSEVIEIFDKWIRQNSKELYYDTGKI